MAFDVPTTPEGDKVDPTGRAIDDFLRNLFASAGAMPPSTQRAMPMDVSGRPMAARGIQMETLPPLPSAPTTGAEAEAKVPLSEFGPEPSSAVVAPSTPPTFPAPMRKPMMPQEGAPGQAYNNRLIRAMLAKRGQSPAQPQPQPTSPVFDDELLPF